LLELIPLSYLSVDKSPCGLPWEGAPYGVALQSPRCGGPQRSHCCKESFSVEMDKPHSKNAGLWDNIDILRKTELQKKEKKIAVAVLPDVH